MFTVYVNGLLVGCVSAVNDYTAITVAVETFGLKEYDAITVTSVGPRRNGF